MFFKNIKKLTSRNNIEFFVSEKFLKKYPLKEDWKGLEYKIEKEYLDCSKRKTNQKNKIA